MISNIFREVPEVLHIIVDDEVRNDSVDERRGHRHRHQDSATAKEIEG
jgi:hypothetical protein